MTHEDDQVFERLTTLSSQLESAVELSSTLQDQHAAAQSTISALESKVIALEEPDSVTQALNEWKKSVTLGGSLVSILRNLS